MEQNLWPMLCKTLESFSSHDTTPRLIQKLFRLMSQHCACHSAAVVFKNPKNDYLEISHSHNIFRDSVHRFQRQVGTRLIGRLFFTDPFVIVTPAQVDDYQEFLIDEPYQLAIGARIATQGRPLGFLVVYFAQPFTVTDPMRSFINSVASLISASIEREEMEDLVRNLRRVDPKTGLLTPNYLLLRLTEEISKARRSKQNLVTALFDIDNFKSIIDRYSLSAAQELYRLVGEELKTCIRGVDVLGLFGTDEYFLYLPNTSVHDADVVIRRFHQSMNTRRFTKDNISTSLSIGITQLAHSDSLETLVQRTQVAFHQARQAGIGQIKILN
ncbi:MAG TPA: GGDEF domain-containing protein [Candidatus Ozemobacteraceae bacterium]|nr:GGDEF domain-containing protein [Candidatus Ozemobacteraceae bacterium]